MQVVGADRGGGPARRGHPDDQLAGLPAAGDGERRRGEHGQGVVGAAGLADRLLDAVVPLLHLRQARRAADEGDPPVPALEQVLGGEPAAEDVVDGDRALVGGRRPAVDEDDGHAAVAQRRQGGGEHGGRRDEDALDALLGEHVEVGGLLGLPVVGVAEDDGQALGVGRLLDAAGHVGEERVGDVEDDQADGPAARRRAAGGPTRCARSPGRRSRSRTRRRVASLTDARAG